jgi:hypothetical protein
MSLAAPSAPRPTGALHAAARRHAAAALLFAAIGIEIVVLLSWAPDTLGSWLNPGKNGYGDFPIFYNNARTFSFNALYSPGLAVLMHPLTYMGERPAFGVYTGVNILALAAVAFIAQRAVASWPAKVAIVLGMFALPQTHWSMRIGHFTQVLAIAALLGLMLSDRKPVLAGLCIAMLALKPQYLPVPLLYLLFTRNWRALATVAAAFVVLGLAGVAAMAARDPSGIRMFVYAGSYYHDRIPEAWSFLTVGQRDQLYPQGWQYSWYGFLLSIGQQPNPLIAADLMLLTLAAAVVCWWKCTPSVAKVAAALAMLMLAPHSSFYNWSMLSVAAALLLHSDLRPRALVPALLVTMAVAAAASQAATPFPLPYDAYRPAGTLGVYWVQPAALLAIVVLAIFGRRDRASLAARLPQIVAGIRSAARAATASSSAASSAHSLATTNALDTAAVSPVPSSIRRARTALTLAPVVRRFASSLAVASVMISSGALAGAFITGAGPFRTDGDFARGRILAALPADFPVPPQSDIEDTGAGAHYPYRVEWRTDAPTSEVAGLMRQRLDDGTWRVVDTSAPANSPSAHSAGDTVSTFRTARSADGATPVIAEINVEPSGSGSRVRVEFSPLPASSIPGYQRWLQHAGLVVHDVDPASPAGQVTPAP